MTFRSNVQLQYSKTYSQFPFRLRVRRFCSALAIWVPNKLPCFSARTRADPHRCACQRQLDVALKGILDPIFRDGSGLPVVRVLWRSQQPHGALEGVLMLDILDSASLPVGPVEHNWIIIAGCSSDGLGRYDRSSETEAIVARRELFVGPDWIAWPCRENDTSVILTVRSHSVPPEPQPGRITHRWQCTWPSVGFDTIVTRLIDRPVTLFPADIYDVQVVLDDHDTTAEHWTVDIWPRILAE